MGEAKRKNQTREAIIAAEPRCIYCSGPVDTLEHMPPTGMFRGRQRPGGMEYAACGVCNNGTRGSDAVAALMARIHPDNGAGSWQTEGMRRLISAIDRYAPGCAGRNELAEQGQPRVGPPSELRRSPASSSGPRGWASRQSASQCFRGETGDGAVPRACRRCATAIRRRLVLVCAEWWYDAGKLERAHSNPSNLRHASARSQECEATFCTATTCGAGDRAWLIPRPLVPSLSSPVHFLASSRTRPRVRPGGLRLFTGCVGEAKFFASYPLSFGLRGNDWVVNFVAHFGRCPVVSLGFFPSFGVSSQFSLGRVIRPARAPSRVFLAFFLYRSPQVFAE